MTEPAPPLACLDWLLISSRRQLGRVLHTYVEHYTPTGRIALSG